MRKVIVIAIIFILAILNGNGKEVYQKSIPVGDAEYKPINHAPVALINAGRMGKILVLDASPSYDPDGDAIQYRWDFDNDGVWDTPWLDNPEIKIQQGNNKVVRLEVNDGMKKDDCIYRIIQNNGSIDQKQEQADGYVRIYGDICYAQSFKPTMMGFDGIDLLIGRKGMILPPILKKFFPFLSKFFLGNISIAIYANLSGEKLAETALKPDDIGSQAWIHINFSLTLKYNQTYYIVVCADGGNEWQYYKWYYGRGNLYGRGNPYRMDGKWNKMPNIDFCFRSYGHKTGDEPDGIVERWAVIFGCLDTFVGLSYYADDDAYDIEQTLLSHGWEKEHVKVLISPTLNEISVAMKWLANMDDMDDIDLVAWTSHGSEDGFAAKDQMVKYEENMKPWLEKCAASAIFIAADTCHAGGAILHLAKEGRVIMASSKADELSYAIPQIKNSIFSYYLADPSAGALNKKSLDTNHDGWISAEEAFPYVYKNVLDYMFIRWRIYQHPQLYDGYEGEIKITKFN